MSKQYFEDVAEQWDEMRKGFFSEVVREKAYKVAEIRSGELAVDVGAGTGFLTEGLLKSGLKVIAVDQSEAMLDEMKKKFEVFQAVEYRTGESENLPIEDKTVDYVFSNMYLHHVKSPLNAIKEMVRVLKPGGKLIITDLDEHRFEFLRKEQHDHWMGFRREDIEKWFIEAGLSQVKVECAGEYCCSDSAGCGCESVDISIFIASGSKRGSQLEAAR